MKNIAVFGASGAIGRAFIELINKKYESVKVYSFSRTDIHFDSKNVLHSKLDLEDELSIKKAAKNLDENIKFDLIFIASGILHNDEIMPEKSIDEIGEYAFEKIFNVNCFGPALVAKYFTKFLNKESKSVFAAISARVGSIGDNQLGGWYAYRASKAALNMILKTLSIEMARKNKKAIIVGLHPGTVKSNLSKPFTSNIEKEKLFSAEYSAEKLLNVIENLKQEDSGKVFDYAAKIIPN